MQGRKHSTWRGAAAAAIVLLLCFGTCFAQSVTIQNGTRFDNDVQAHSGGILQVGKTFYWVGGIYDADNKWSAAFNLYSSTDLAHWKFLGAVLTPESSPELRNRIWERPHILHNETTGKFVMWFKLRKGPDSSAAVAVSDTITGPYRFVSSQKPFGDRSGDPTLFKDVDGRAYLISADNTRGQAGEHHTMNIYRLTPDYLDVDHSVAPTLITFSMHSEAPALFKRGKLYYLIVSGTTGWRPNQQKYMTAPAVQGPWGNETNLADADCYHSQTTAVIELHGDKETSYLWLGDQWALIGQHDSSGSESTYRWLPLEFAPDGSMKMNNYSSLTVNVQTGEIVGHK